MTRRRQRPLGRVLGPLEEEVMEAVWKLGVVTVRDVLAVLERSRPVAYTTVMTTMGRLADKGLLRRTEILPAHRYVALVSRQQYADSTCESVLDWLLGQFGEPAVAYFLDRVEREDGRLIENLSGAVAEAEARAREGE
ncbi:MAG: BlaI/MecI/CopY family transcriptional regulator [Actinobacteria bacterium]|nr:BlaI/MecI/CopY family transcriptional regulator [Actinomycetota bacterium]